MLNDNRYMTIVTFVTQCHKTNSSMFTFQDTEGKKTTEKRFGEVVDRKPFQLFNMMFL